MKVKISKVQLALFSPGVDLSDKLALAGNIRKGSASLFSGEPILLPVPDDAPNEIPRIILKDKKGKVNLHISVNRIDLHIRDLILAGNVPVVYSKLNNNLIEVYKLLLKTLFSITSLAVNRVGFIVIGEVEAKNASTGIASKYMAEGVRKNKWHEVNVNLLKRETIDKKKSNIWLRLHPGRKKDGEVDNSKMVVMFEINTLPKESYSFVAKDVLSYIKQSSSYLASYSKEILL